MRFLKWLLGAAALLVPSLALATISLTSAGGYLFDVQDTYGGELSNGSIDAYDGAYYLEVNGTTYTSSSGTATTTLGGRNVVMPTTTISGLSVHRQIYVPATGGDYARYLDVVQNPGASAATVTITVRGNLGSDSGTILYSSSSGDATFTTADSWFGTDDADGSGDPSLAHVIQGSSPRVGPTAASLTSDNFSWTFSTSVPAGGRVALLTYAVQTGSRAAATTEAMRLSEAPDDALTGIDDYLDDIINFSIAEPGAPRIRFDGPFSIEEGEEATISITVEDLEGDAVSWSWDTNDDGTFGEMADATSYTVPAGSTDGDGVVRVGVSASDGTNVTERYRSITVTNVAPTIVSSPDIVTSVGASYRYQIEVDDPGSAHETFSYAVTGPSSMVVSATGLVTWTPRETDVTSPDELITVTVSVDDGDMGTATQTWDLTVSPNRAPSAPTPIYPIGNVALGDRSPRLVAANASDPDRDALTYFFQIDTSETFDSPALQESGPVMQTPGYSYWYVETPLSPGLWHWRVWVSDGTVETEPVAESFIVAGGPVVPVDAGPVPDGSIERVDGGVIARPRDDSGCSVGSTREAPVPLFLGVLALLAWRSRRSRLP